MYFITAQFLSLFHYYKLRNLNTNINFCIKIFDFNYVYYEQNVD